MNKLYTLLLSLAALGSSAYTANAQCTPDPNNLQEGVTPENLPAACESEMYDQTLQLRFKTDSTFENVQTPFGVIPSIDADLIRIEVISFNNLPAGMDYECETSDCVKEIPVENSYDNTCLRVDGTPAASGDGSAAMILNLTFQVSFAGNTQDSTVIDTAYIDYTVNDAGTCIPTSTNDVVKTGVNISPNPLKSNSNVTLSLTSASYASLKIYDILGSEIGIVELGALPAGQTTIAAPFTNLNSGLYIVKLMLDGIETSYIEKIIVE